MSFYEMYVKIERVLSILIFGPALKFPGKKSLPSAKDGIADIPIKILSEQLRNWSWFEPTHILNVIWDSCKIKINILVEILNQMRKKREGRERELFEDSL